MQKLLTLIHTNRDFLSFVFRTYFSLVKTPCFRLMLSKWPCSQIPLAIATMPVEMNTTGGQKFGAIKGFKPPCIMFTLD